MRYSTKHLAILLTAVYVLVLLCGCVQKIHYDTFDELLASIEVADIPDEEREIKTVLLWSETEYLGGADFRHLSEYDGLSDNIAEFATGYSQKALGGTWYYPEGRNKHDFLIFINNDGEATIWQKIIIYVVPD